MTKTFEILVSEIITKTLIIEAKDETDAENKIDEGLFNAEDIRKEDLVERNVHEVVEIKEVA